MESILTKIITGIVALGTFLATPFIAPFQLPELQNKVAELESQLAVQQEELNLGAFNVTGGGTYRLKSSIGLTDSSVSLSSFKEPVSNTSYTMSYLNTTVAYGTIDPQTSRSEFVSFTGITQNADGSATLTGVTRGLTRTPAGSLCTASSTLAQRHPGQSVFILSDSPCLFAEYPVKRNDETVTGQWEFPYPSASSSVATKGYVDSVSFGTLYMDRLAVAGTAGQTIAAGDLIYLRASDGEWYLSDADVSTSTIGVVLGIAQGAGTDGVAISGGVLVHGLDTNQSGLVAGTEYYVSTTAGDITATAPTVLATTTRTVGYARNTTSLYLEPYARYASTQFPNAFNATSTFAATTTFSAPVTIVSTSSLSVGAFTAWDGFFKQRQVITTTGTSTFTVPSGITKAFVEIVGGGGAGGCANGTNYAGAAGGGGGGYANEIVDLTGTTSVQVFVGSGGANPAGCAGETSSSWTTFGTNGYYLSATGGSNGSGVGGGAGGIGSGGDVNIGGQGGGAGKIDTTDAFTFGGVGGSSELGGGGYASQGTTAEVDGGAGRFYGGGGGGGVTQNGNAAGGSGAQGIIIIRW